MMRVEGRPRDGGRALGHRLRSRTAAGQAFPDNRPITCATATPSRATPSDARAAGMAARSRRRVFRRRAALAVGTRRRADGEQSRRRRGSA